MSFRLITHSQASREHADSAEWYERQQHGLGERYMAAIGKRIAEIAANPEQFGFLKGNYRQVKVEGFPIIVLYEFFPHKELIHVAAIFHTGRDPRKKFRREEKVER